MVTYRLWIKKWQWVGGSDFGTVGKRRWRRSEWYQFGRGSGSIEGDLVVYVERERERGKKKILVQKKKEW
jgi:hypothetical protein